MARDELAALLGDVKELEDFLHQFLDGLHEYNVKPGADVVPYVEKMGLRIPQALAGTSMTYDGHGPNPEDGDTLVLVRPGHPSAVGLTIGCITVRGVRICLECGWIFCRIVIHGRF